ncbi:putative ribonuclease h protein [Quercus suber]|uniref:Ribonuclease h protein n=1 Tax=Quercus suber TaxID=58331 RepID=A0AAW0M4I0_QUESU
MVVWSIWLRRNNMAYERLGNHRDLLSQTLMKAAEVAYLSLNGKQGSEQVKIQVKWTPPPLHWFKPNSDGSSLGNPGLAGGGGIIRDSAGNWVKGYARTIGVTTSVAAELWALRDGIRLCIALKLPAVEIELDAKVMADLVSSNSSKLNYTDVIVTDYKEGLKKIPLVRIKHCFRAAF